jgi:AbiV family abortive infection protein
MANKGEKPPSYNFSEDQLRNTIKRCIENVRGLLESADCLRKDERTVQYALGLYMYAVEEYGKAHLLKSYLGQVGSHFLIPRWIFGVGHPPTNNTSHNEKLQEGFRRLPLDCRKLTNSVTIHENPSSKSRVDTIKTPTGSISITMAPNSTGISSFRSHPTRELNNDLKTGCFYIDWDENKMEPNFIFPAQEGQLLYNIRLMKRAVLDFHW